MMFQQAVSTACYSVYQCENKVPTFSKLNAGTRALTGDQKNLDSAIRSSFWNATNFAGCLVWMKSVVRLMNPAGRFA